MSYRTWHYLKPNAVSETIHRAIFVDCETDDVVRPDGITEKHLRFGWACFTERNGRGEWTKPTWKRFTDYEDFWLWAIGFVASKKRTWMWCHNSRFDYPVLRVGSHLKKMGWKCLNMVWEAPPTIIRFRLAKRTLILADTMNIFRMSVKTLGKMIGLEKLEMPRDWKDDSTDDAYCRRDVEIIRKALCDWSDFLRREDMGGFAPTIAGQAMRTFRHRYMDDRILIEGDGVALKLARNAYKGGRVECGYIGHLEQPVYHLDINSMYPSIMATEDLPTRLIRYTEYISIRDVAELLGKYCLIAKVRLKTDHPFAWVLENHKLVFPVGEFDAYLTSPELAYAIENGFVADVYCAAIYERAPIFRHFALDLYQQKENASRNGRLVDKEHWKLLLNSFSGKWGQNGRHFRLVDKGPPQVKGRDGLMRNVDITYDIETGKETHWRYFGGYILACTPEAESYESHPAIIAHITGHARMILWAMIREVTSQNYLYCDTDAIFTTQAGFDKLYHRIDDHCLGFLKHVATYNDVWIYGAKDYVVDGKRVCKGVRDDAEQLDEGVFQQVRWYGLPGLARADSIDTPLTRIITKSLRRAYAKGTVTPSGLVVPLHYPLTSSS